MEPTPSFDESAVPCPQCSYDLRATTTLRCPECGAAFTSLDDLIAASREAQRIYNRVLKYRIRIACAIALCMVFCFMLIAFVSASPIATPLLRLVFVAGMLLLPLTCGAAFVLMLQVLRWRFDRRIGVRQRRELTGSFPILFIESLPFMLCLPTLIYFVFRMIYRFLG